MTEDTGAIEDTEVTETLDQLPTETLVTLPTLGELPKPLGQPIGGSEGNVVEEVLPVRARS